MAQINLFFGHVCQRFDLRCCLALLIFCQFQPGVAYKSVAFSKKKKKSVNVYSFQCKFSYMIDRIIKMWWKKKQHYNDLKYFFNDSLIQLHHGCFLQLSVRKNLLPNHDYFWKLFLPKQSPRGVRILWNFWEHLFL